MELVCSPEELRIPLIVFIWPLGSGVKEDASRKS